MVALLQEFRKIRHRRTRSLSHLATNDNKETQVGVKHHKRSGSLPSQPPCDSSKALASEHKLSAASKKNFNPLVNHQKNHIQPIAVRKEMVARPHGALKTMTTDLLPKISKLELKNG